MFVDYDMAEIALKLAAVYGLCNRLSMFITEGETKHSEAPRLQAGRGLIADISQVPSTLSWREGSLALSS